LFLDANMPLTLIHTLLLFPLLVQTAKKPFPENIYPAWFLDPPSDQKMVAVGYSDVHAYIDSAIKSATREAATNLVKNGQVQIIGEQGLATLAAGTILVGSTIKEYYDTTEAGRLGSTMKVVDYFQRSGAVTILVSTDSAKTTAAFGRVDASKLPRPPWTTQTPDKGGYLYCSGLAPVYYYENNSWREAERKARINLALTLYTKVKYLGKKVDQSYYREFQVEETNATLRGIEVVARWKDVKNQVCYVLMRMPVSTQGKQ
jgi:hypothetical protein